MANKNNRAEKYIYACMHAKSLQLCPTLCDPMDCSLSGSSVHGIFQVRILEWVAISFSRRSSWPRDQTCNSYVSCIGRWVLYHRHHLGSTLPPKYIYMLHIIYLTKQLDAFTKIISAELSKLKANAFPFKRSRKQLTKRFKATYAS